MDEIKDKYIKEKLNQDKIISNQANHVFENFKIHSIENIEYSTKEKNKVININKMLSIAASFLLIIFIGTGAFVYNQFNDNTKTQMNLTTVNIVNSEALIDNEVIINQSENELVKVSLTGKNKILVQIKEKYQQKMGIDIDTEKEYEMIRISSEKVVDIFAGYCYNKNNVNILLLMEDGTVNYSYIIQEGNSISIKEIGIVMGIYNIVGFEQKTEPLVDSNEKYYYINGITQDGLKKEITIGLIHNMDDLSKNKVSFKSQDGNKSYDIYAKDGNYIQAAGWAGASNNVYYINDNNLYHMELVSGNTARLITGASKIYTDEDSQIIVELKAINNIHKKDDYVLINSFGASSAKIISKQETDTLKVDCREDGSITIRVFPGGLEKLGITGKTNIKENTIYNVYCQGNGVKYGSTYNYYANAKSVFIGKVGKEQKLCLTYVTKNDIVYCLDIISAIEKGNFITTSYKTIRGLTNITGLKSDIESTIKTSEGTSIEPFETIFILYDNGNKSISII